MTTTHRHAALAAIGGVLTLGLYAAASLAAAERAATASIRLASSRVSIAGTSNIHAYTASTTAARIVRLQLADGVAFAWDELSKPGAIEAFEVSIPAATLSSPKEGLDKNMHKALKVTEHADITFHLTRLEPAAGGFRALGTLTVAGAAREVSIDLKVRHTDATLVVSGEVSLLMTDFGIAPPKAMLGMLKTDPKVTVSFETIFAIPLT